MHVRIYVSARTHTRTRVGPPALCSLRITSPSLSLSRAIARFRPRRAKECRFYRSVNITVTNTGSGERYPSAASSSAHAHMHRRERGLRLCVGCGTSPSPMPLFSLSSFPRLARSNPRIPRRAFRANARKNYRACFYNFDRSTD